MKPIYTSAFAFRSFFDSPQIKIFDLLYEEDLMKVFYDTIDIGVLPKDYPPPGIYVLVNNLKALYEGECFFNFEYYLRIKDLERNLLGEIENNIRFTTSNNEIDKYLAEVNLILKTCENSIIENKNRLEDNYEYSGAKIELIPSKDLDDATGRIILNKFFWNLKTHLREFLAEVVNKINDTKIKQVNLQYVKSFKLTKNVYSSKVSTVFTDLISHNLIEAKFEQLLAVFSNKKIDFPIKWKGGHGDLKTFVTALIDHKIVEDPKRKIWEITISCFVKGDATLFTNKEIRCSKKTSRYNEINYIIRKFIA